MRFKKKRTFLGWPECNNVCGQEMEPKSHYLRTIGLLLSRKEEYFEMLSSLFLLPLSLSWVLLEQYLPTCPPWCSFPLLSYSYMLGYCLGVSRLVAIGQKQKCPGVDSEYKEWDIQSTKEIGMRSSVLKPGCGRLEVRGRDLSPLPLGELSLWRLRKFTTKLCFWKRNLLRARWNSTSISWCSKLVGHLETTSLWTSQSRLHFTVSWRSTFVVSWGHPESWPISWTCVSLVRQCGKWYMF